MKQAFDKYDKACGRALDALGLALIDEIQRLLAIAKVDGEFYVCTGMGLCNLSADKVIYQDKDDPDSPPYESDDDFDLGNKLKEDSRYFCQVVVSDASRAALLQVQEICEQLQDRDLMQALPYCVYHNRIEHYTYKGKTEV